MLEDNALEDRLPGTELSATLELIALDTTILTLLEIKLLWLAGDDTDTAPPALLLETPPASAELAILEDKRLEALRPGLLFAAAELLANGAEDNTEFERDDSLSEPLFELPPEPPPQAASNNILVTIKVFCMNFVLEL